MRQANLASRPFDVIGLGVNALDLIAIIDGYPEPDTKVQFQEFDVQGGGVVATAMAACARLSFAYFPESAERPPARTRTA